MREERKARTLRMFIASTALVVQAMKRDPEQARVECRKLGVKGRRPEMQALRLAAGDPGLREPKWANAAAYVAQPPNGDGAPTTLREAARYMRERGGMRELSNLWTAHQKGEPKVPPALEDWGDAMLTGIDPDFTIKPQNYCRTYAVALVRFGGDANDENVWLIEDDDLARRLITRVKKTAIIKDGPRDYIENYAAARAAPADIPDDDSELDEDDFSKDEDDRLGVMADRKPGDQLFVWGNDGIIKWQVLRVPAGKLPSPLMGDIVNRDYPTAGDAMEAGRRISERWGVPLYGKPVEYMGSRSSFTARRKETPPLTGQARHVRFQG